MRKFLLIFLLPLGALAALPSPATFTNPSVTATAVKANQIAPTPNQVLQYNVQNPNSSTVFLQIFDAASTSSVTLGTTVPTYVIAVPAFGVTDGPMGSPQYVFRNGIIIAATTTAAGAAAPATAVAVTLVYE